MKGSIVVKNYKRRRYEEFYCLQGCSQYQGGLYWELISPLYGSHENEKIFYVREITKGDQRGMYEVTGEQQIVNTKEALEQLKNDVTVSMLQQRLCYVFVDSKGETLKKEYAATEQNAILMTYPSVVGKMTDDEYDSNIALFVLSDISLQESIAKLDIDFNRFTWDDTEAIFHDADVLCCQIVPRDSGFTEIKDIYDQDHITRVINHHQKIKENLLLLLTPEDVVYSGFGKDEMIQKINEWATMYNEPLEDDKLSRYLVKALHSVKFREDYLDFIRNQTLIQSGIEGTNGLFPEASAAEDELNWLKNLRPDAWPSIETDLVQYNGQLGIVADLEFDCDEYLTVSGQTREGVVEERKLKASELFQKLPLAKVFLGLYGLPDDLSDHIAVFLPVNLGNDYIHNALKYIKDNVVN